MRDVLVLAIVLFTLAYAFRDWFRALCILIAFTALQDYPGLPNPFGAKGINHWSVMLAGVTLAWAVTRLGDSRGPNLTLGWWVALSAYLFVEGIGLLRLLLQLEDFKASAGAVSEAYLGYDTKGILVDYFYTPARYMWLAFMLLDGARTRERILEALLAIFAAMLLYAVIVCKEIPPRALIEGGMAFRDRIPKWTGRHPNDLARIFGAGFWIAVCFAQLRVGSSWLRWGALGCAGLLALGLAHTQSRGGIVGFIACGLILTVVMKSWKNIALLGAIGVVVVAAAPGLMARVLEGVDTSGAGAHDVDSLTAGRDVIWQAALDAIEHSPLIGYGTYGYVTSHALTRSVQWGGGENHPHNAYLETLLDQGLLLAPGRLAPFLYVLWVAIGLVRRRGDDPLRLAGVAGVAYVTALFAMGLTGQHFGLTEKPYTFWCIASLVVAAARLSQPAPARRGMSPAGFANTGMAALARR